MKVYLCGPINGCTDEECKDWREAAKRVLPDTLDPMKRDYRGKERASYREIVELDKRDVRLFADVVLCNCPSPSWGTGMEIIYAWEYGKIGVAVVPPGMVLSEPERKALAGVMTAAEMEAGDVDDIAPRIEDDEDAYWAFHRYHGLRKLLAAAPTPPATAGKE